MATAVIKDHASQKRRNFISKFLIYFFLIVITACMLLPFLWMLSSSFKLNKDVFGFPIQWIPKNPRWQNYVDIWTQIPLLTFVKNTVKITVVVTLLQLFTSSFAAYAFAKMQFKGKNALFLGYIATIAVPWQAYMVPQFMMMSLVAFEQHPSGHYVPAGLQRLRRVPDETVLRGRAHRAV